MPQTAPNFHQRNHREHDLQNSMGTADDIGFFSFSGVGGDINVVDSELTITAEEDVGSILGTKA